MAKDVSFGQPTPKQVLTKKEAAQQAWLEKNSGEVAPAPAVSADKKDKEDTTRLTINLPKSLHRRVKVQCFNENILMTDVIRAFLEERFPEK